MSAIRDQVALVTGSEPQSLDCMRNTEPRSWSTGEMAPHCLPSEEKSSLQAAVRCR